jgi:hypothetical protein
MKTCLIGCRVKIYPKDLAGPIGHYCGAIMLVLSQYSWSGRTWLVVMHQGGKMLDVALDEVLMHRPRKARKRLKQEKS